MSMLQTGSVSGTVQIPSIIQGNDGATFTPSVSEDGTLSWTNNKGLPNPDAVNIKGPKGDTDTCVDVLTSAISVGLIDPVADENNKLYTSTTGEVYVL